MSISSLPDPRQSYLFRHLYGPEAINDARLKVQDLYNAPVVTEFNGEYRGKDTFSYICVREEAAKEQGINPEEQFSYFQHWNPIRRNDMHPDDVSPTHTIEYNFFDRTRQLTYLPRGEKPESLTARAVKRAKEILDAQADTEHGRAILPPHYVEMLGPVRQADLTKPLTAQQKKKQPSVMVSQNIMHYFAPEERVQHIQNAAETQPEGSRFIVGADEVKLDDVPGALHRNGYMPDEAANLKIQRQKRANKVYCLEKPFEVIKPAQTFVYIKTGQ